MGLEFIPVRIATGWSEVQKRAYVVADNKLTENGGWDRDLQRYSVFLRILPNGTNALDSKLGQGEEPQASGGGV
jgi:hypothetical protein